MTMVRGAFSNNLVPGYRKILFETYREKPTEGSVWIHMNTSRRAFEQDFNMAGFGTLPQKPEGGSVIYQDALQGNIKTYTFSTYGLGFRITQELMEDDLYGIMGNKMSKALGRSARNNFEVISHSVLNNAFNTAFTGFEPSNSLCATSHTTLRGLTIGNRPSGDADIGLLAIQAGLEHFHNLIDESGLPIMYIPKWVMYNIGDHWIVNQVLKSQYLPGSALNDINQVANENMSPLLSHYLTDNDSWYILCDNHDVNYFDRRPPTFSNTDDFETGDAKFKLTRRNTAGYGDWRGVYGSTGV
jgi:hypothetical protein